MKLITDLKLYKKLIEDLYRLAILEWPYRIQESGPPIAHRVDRDEINRLADQTGFSRIEVFELAHFLLYRLEKNKIYPSLNLSFLL